MNDNMEPDGPPPWTEIDACNMQEILNGLAPGQQVVANALVLQNTVEQ